MPLGRLVKSAFLNNQTIKHCWFNDYLGKYFVIKTALFVLTLLSTLAFWVVEPYSSNPFHKLEHPAISSSINTSCDAGTKIKESADAALKQYMESNRFLGVNVGFYHADCGTYLAGAGFKDKRNLSNVNQNTVNRIASITKPMTAIAIMQLHERGLIELDAPIQNYIPNFPIYSNVPITIRHLLNHTSGTPHYTSKLDAISFTQYNTLATAVEAISEKALIDNPGEQYVYSSFGYTVLGAIIEQVSNQDFEQYMSSKIWKVAGMNNTRLERSFSAENKSRLYLKLGAQYIRSPYSDLSIIYPAGGVESTAEDLLLFGKAILNNTLISKKSLDLMTDVSQSLAPMAGDDPYGFGWSVYKDTGKGTRIAHSGGQPGASGYFEVNLDKQIVIVTLSNAFGTKSSAYNLTQEIAELAF